MKKWFLSFLLIVSILVLPTCSSGEQTPKKGHPDQPKTFAELVPVDLKFHCFIPTRA